MSLYLLCAASATAGFILGVLVMCIFGCSGRGRHEPPDGPGLAEWDEYTPPAPGGKG